MARILLFPLTDHDTSVHTLDTEGEGDMRVLGKLVAPQLGTSRVVVLDRHRSVVDLHCPIWLLVAIHRAETPMGDTFLRMYYTTTALPTSSLCTSRMLMTLVDVHALCTPEYASLRAWLIDESMAERTIETAMGTIERVGVDRVRSTVTGVTTSRATFVRRMEVRSTDTIGVWSDEHEAYRVVRPVGTELVFVLPHEGSNASTPKRRVDATAASRKRRRSLGERGSDDGLPRCRLPRLA